MTNKGFGVKDINIGAGTSISSPATNVLTLGTNSVERVRIASDGNVGVNATNPERKLEVVDTAGSLTFPVAVSNHTDASAGVGAGIAFHLTSGGNARGDFGVVYAGNSNSDGTDFIFRPNDGSTGQVERLRITSGGAVGIATDNPTFGQSTPVSTYNPKLGVEGSIIIGNLNTTASDRSELQFYRRAGAYAQPIDTHDMGRIAWYGSSNDSNNANLAWSIGVTPDGGSWTSGSNRKGHMSFNNHDGEKLRINSNGDVTMRGTDSQYIEMASFRTSNGSTLVTNNGGFLEFTPIENTNTSVITHSTSSNPSRITFPVAGVVHINFHQDIRSGNATNSGHYDYIRFKKNGSNILNSLIKSTSDFWDSIYGTVTVELSANDYIELELNTNSSITSWDDSGWSSYNVIFAPINTNR